MIVKNINLKGSTVLINGESYFFDNDGKCDVDDKLALSLGKLKGYELTKIPLNEDVDYNKKSIQELRDILDEKNIEYTKTDKKSQLLEKLK